MEAEIRDAYPDADVKLIEASGGAFEVLLDGQLIFSKLSLGRHAKEGEVVGLLNDRSG